MPLHPQSVGMPGELQGLDHAIRGTRNDPQVGRGRKDGLMVKAVDLQALLAQGCGQVGGWIDLNPVDELVARGSLRRIMRQRLGNFAFNVQDEAAAQSRVEHLNPAADAKERLALPRSPADEGELECVARLARVFDGRARGDSQAQVGNISAAGEKETIQPLKQVAQSCAGEPHGNNNRRGPGLGQGH